MDKMRDLRKILLVVVLTILGSLLTLAGMGLIELSQDLLLYAGIFQLALAVGFFFLL